MTPIAIHIGSSVTAKTTIPVVSPTPIHCPVLPALKEFFDLLSTFTLQFYFVILINSSNLKLLTRYLSTNLKTRMLLVYLVYFYSF